MSVVARNRLLLQGVSRKRYDSYISDQLELVISGWDAYIRGDIEGVIETLDPDIVWDLTHFQGWIEDQIYCGHDGARRFMHDWAGTWEDYEVGIKQYVESGDRVLSLSWQRGAGAGSHVPVELDLAQIATVRGGLIVRFEVWSDCGAAMQSLTATQ